MSEAKKTKNSVSESKKKDTVKKQSTLIKKDSVDSKNKESKESAQKKSVEENKKVIEIKVDGPAPKVVEKRTAPKITSISNAKVSSDLNKDNIEENGNSNSPEITKSKAKSISKSKKEKKPKSKKFKIVASLGVITVLGLSLGLGLGLGLKDKSSGEGYLSFGSDNNQTIKDPSDLDGIVNDPNALENELAKLIDQARIFTFDKLSAQGFINNPDVIKEKAETNAQQNIDQQKSDYEDQYGKTWEDDWNEELNTLGFNNESEYKNSLVSEALVSSISSELEFRTVYVDSNKVTPNPSEVTDFQLVEDQDSENYLQWEIIDSTGNPTGEYYNPNQPNSGNINYDQKYCSLSQSSTAKKVCVAPEIQEAYDMFLEEFKPIATSHILFGATYSQSVDSSTEESTDDGSTEEETTSSEVTGPVAKFDQSQITNLYQFLLYSDNVNASSSSNFDFELAASQFGSDGSTSSGGSLGVSSALATGFEQEFVIGIFSSLTDESSNDYLGYTSYNKDPVYSDSVGGSSYQFFSSDWIWNTLNEIVNIDPSIPNAVWASSQEEFNKNPGAYLDLFDGDFSSFNNLASNAYSGLAELNIKDATVNARDSIYKFSIDRVVDTYYDSNINSTSSSANTISNFDYPLEISRNGIHILRIDELYPEEYYSGLNLSTTSNGVYPGDSNYYTSPGIHYLTNGENILLELGYRYLVADLNETILNGTPDYNMRSSFDTWMSSNTDYYITKTALNSSEFQKNFIESTELETEIEEQEYMDSLLEYFNNKYYNKFEVQYNDFYESIYLFYLTYKSVYGIDTVSASGGPNPTESQIKNWLIEMQDYLLPNTNTWEVKNLTKT